MAMKKQYKCVKCKKHFGEEETVKVATDPNVLKDEYWCVGCNAKRIGGRFRMEGIPLPPKNESTNHEIGIEGIPKDLAEQLLEVVKKQEKKGK